MWPDDDCEDCLPRDATIVGASARLDARDVVLPPQACYIRCGAACEEFMNRHFPVEEHEVRRVCAVGFVFSLLLARLPSGWCHIITAVSR